VISDAKLHAFAEISKCLSFFFGAKLVIVHLAGVTGCNFAENETLDRFLVMKKVILASALVMLTCWSCGSKKGVMRQSESEMAVKAKSGSELRYAEAESLLSVSEVSIDSVVVNLVRDSAGGESRRVTFHGVASGRKTGLSRKADVQVRDSLVAKHVKACAEQARETRTVASGMRHAWIVWAGLILAGVLVWKWRSRR